MSTNGNGKDSRIPPKGGSSTSIPIAGSTPARITSESDLTPEDKLRLIGNQVANALATRMKWLEQLTPDRRRSIPDECGYVKGAISLQQYRDLYERDPLADRVVGVLPDECWQTSPTVYEKEDAEVRTPFEVAWAALGRGIKGWKSWHREEVGSVIWDYLRRADKLSGIGAFGIILLGLDDGLPYDQPVKGLPADYDGSPYGSRTRGPAPTDTYTGTDTNPMVTPKVRVYPSNPSNNDDQNPLWNALYPSSDTPKPPGNPTKPTAKQGKTPAIPKEIKKTPSETLPEMPNTPRKLVFLRVFPQHLVEIQEFEKQKSSPRYGQPVLYRITFNDPESTTPQEGGEIVSQSQQTVHWTRVIHVADNTDDSEVFGVPRLRTVYDTICDSRKIYGGDAEAFWKNCLMRLILESQSSLGGDLDVDMSSIKDAMEEFGNGMQPWLALLGFNAKAIAPMVVDPTPHVDAIIEKICIKIPVPKRVFCGSERGQLASAQDEAKWNKIISGRHKQYLTPKLVTPFIDRLIAVKVLPEPEDGYCVHWPDVAAQTESDKADVSLKRTQALNFYVTGECWNVIPPIVFLTLVLGMTQEEANLNLAVLEEYKAKKMEEDRLQQKKDIEAGVAPDPTKPSPDTVLRTDAMAARAKAKPPAGASPRKVKKPNGRPPTA
jgi:hypothetical protein